MISRGYDVFDDSVILSCIGAIEAVEEAVLRGDGLQREQIDPPMFSAIPKRAEARVTAPDGR